MPRNNSVWINCPREVAGVITVLRGEYTSHTECFSQEKTMLDSTYSIILLSLRKKCVYFFGGIMVLYSGYGERENREDKK